MYFRAFMSCWLWSLFKLLRLNIKQLQKMSSTRLLLLKFFSCWQPLIFNSPSWMYGFHFILTIHGPTLRRPKGSILLHVNHEWVHVMLHTQAWMTACNILPCFLSSCFCLVAKISRSFVVHVHIWLCDSAFHVFPSYVPVACKEQHYKSESLCLG